MVELTLTDEGAEKFATATEENLNKQIAIVYDGETDQRPYRQQCDFQRDRPRFPV